MSDPKASFESKISEIDQEISKRRHKWNLTTLAWMDFGDVAQILRIHIYKKWKMYDQKQPLAPWINRIVSNQIKNLIRNKRRNEYIYKIILRIKNSILNSLTLRL